MSGWSRLVFRIRPVPGGPCVVGIIWPSSDEGGLRPFPFSLFVEESTPPRDGLALELELATLLDAFERAYAELRSQPSEAAMAAVLESLAFDRYDLPEPKPEPVPLQAWIEKVYGSDLDRFTLALWRLKQTASTGRESRPSLLLPMSPEFSLAAQVGAWTHICHQIKWPEPSALLAIEKPGQITRLLITMDVPTGSILDRFTAPPPAMTIDLLDRVAPSNLQGIQELQPQILELIESADLRSIGPSLASNHHANS